MLETIFIVAQVTAICGVAGCTARLLIARAPQLAAQICFVGLGLSGLVLLLAGLSAPRLSIAQVQAYWSKTGFEEPTSPADAISARATSAQAARPSAAGLNLSRLGQHFGRASAALDLSAHLPESTPRGLWWAFAVVASVGTLRLLIATAQVLNLRRTRCDYDDAGLASLLDEFCNSQAPTFRLRVYSSAAIPSPCVTWLDRSAIYVPNEFATWTREEREVAVMHEAVHARRLDARWRAAADGLTLSVCFHPLACWLKRLLVFAQELATDREAGRVLSVEKYQRGLCKLALRTDSRRGSSLMVCGVSISTNTLVRRINMLRSQSPAFKRWQSVVALSLVTACGTSIAAWTVAADDDVLRVASRTPKSTQPSSALFSREMAEPWNEVGISDGYAHVVPSMFAYKPFLKKIIDDIQTQALELPGGDSDVLITRDLDSCVSNLSFNVHKIREERAKDGHRYSMSAAMNRFVMQFSREVDWSRVAEQISFRSFMIEENQEPIRKLLRDMGTSPTLRMVSGGGEYSHNYLKAKALWPHIVGGVSTFAFSLDCLEVLDMDYTKANFNPYQVSLFETLRRCEYAGLGLDFEIGKNVNHLRLALVPKSSYSAEELATEVRVAIQRTIAAIGDIAVNADEPENKEPNAESLTSATAWKAHLESWQVRVVATEEPLGDIVLVEGTTGDEPFVLPLM